MHRYSEETAMKNDKFLSFFVYILYTFGTDFRHNYFDCDKKVTICTKFVFFRRIKVLKIWTSKRRSPSERIYNQPTTGKHPLL